MLKVRETKQLIRDQDENGIIAARLRYSQDVALICASRKNKPALILSQKRVDPDA